MRIVIVGAGAIGSAVGAKLHTHGVDVCLVGRKEHVEKIRSEGLKVKGIWGEFCVRDMDVHTEIPPQKFDVAIISVKTFSNREALESIKASGMSAKLFISMQNGLGNYEFFSEHLKPVGNARVIFGVLFERPGEIRVTVWGGPILFGFWDQSLYKDKENTRLLETLADSFVMSDLPSKVVQDIRTPVWEKALYNSALNPLSVILNSNYGEIVDNPFSREVAKEVILEGIPISQKEGAKVKDDFFHHFERELVPPTRDHISSMIQDIRMRGKTEIDSMCGMIVRYGMKHGIFPKVNFVLWKLMKAIEWLCSGLNKAENFEHSQSR